jgi:hypothetical protein
MMKKLLILMLVLGVASVANAAIQIELRDAAGTTTIATGTATGVDLQLGTNYTVYVTGAVADSPATGGIYGPTWTASDWTNLGPANSTTYVDDTGDLSFCNWVAAYQGYDWQAKDSGMGPGVSTGDWVHVDLTALAQGSYSLGLFDYAVSSATAVATISGNVIPEPMTVALLGLGGLLLRRRK